MKRLQDLNIRPGYGGTFHLLRFSWDGKYLATYGLVDPVAIWVRRLQAHSKEVMSVAFREDGKLLASGSRDGEVKLWEFPSGKEMRALKAHTDAVTKVVFHPDGKQLATGSYDGTVKLWNLNAAP